MRRWREWQVVKRKHTLFEGFSAGAFSDGRVRPQDGFEGDSLEADEGPLQSAVVTNGLFQGFVLRLGERPADSFASFLAGPDIIGAIPDPALLVLPE